MTEMASFKESQSSMSANYPAGSIIQEQSKMDMEEMSSAENVKSGSIDQSEEEEEEHAANGSKNNETVDGIELPVKKNVQPKYPLTARSKMKKAAKARMEREKKSEQIKKINENITLGVEAIRNSARKVHGKKFESLIRVNNNQWYHHDRSSAYDLRSSSFDAKIKSLESNLKKLEDELKIGKNMLENNGKGRAIIEVVSDEKSIGANIEEVTEEKNVPNSDDSAFVDICTALNDGHVHETSTKQETRLTFSPDQITIKVKRMDSDHVTNEIFRQQITVSNRSKSTVFCRYSHVIDPSTELQEGLTSAINVRPVVWCRLQPAITVDYAVTFRPAKLPNSVARPSRIGTTTKLVFETASNNQPPDVQYVFHIPVEFCMIKPEPELVTKTITFPVDLNSSDNVNAKRYLVMKNNGDADCVFSVLDETAYRRAHNNNDGSSIATRLTGTTDDDKNNMFKDMIDSMCRNIFRYFMWRNHLNVLLPARRSVKVPVIFNQNLARSSISECYTIAFDQTEYAIPNQKLCVTGHVQDQLLVSPDAIDLGLCYLTSSVQAASIHLRNTNRVMVPFEVKVPREMSKHVQLSRSKGYLKAGSSIEVLVALSLKYGILRPGGNKTYFNAANGSLDFPIRVCPFNSKRFSKVRVTAVVTTPFGLTLTPDTLHFGTVNTTETVVRSIALANHSRATMVYGFLKLPKRVSVHPSAFGTIFSGEMFLLHVHYSPSAKDLPENVHTFVDDFTLTCNTITGLNAKEFNSTKTIEQLDETTTIDPSTLSDFHQSATSMNRNDLDHGPNKIQIIKTKYLADVNVLDENAILNEAIVTCHARVYDIPVEISVQKIVFAKTHFTSYSTFNFELRASNLASLAERNVASFPDFKIRFEFVASDPRVEFKPKNGILQSKEVIQIRVTLRPKLDNELRNVYEECLNSKATQDTTEQISKDLNSYINRVYRRKPFSDEQIKIFEAKTTFYASIKDKTDIVSAACFVQFIREKSIEYFGFDTGSLKLSLVCPTAKPNVILFGDRIGFGKCTMDVRHDEWLLVRNVTADPVPLKISPTNPIGPFFCAFAMNGEQSLLPGQTVPINVSFTPEREMAVNEVLEVKSGTMRLAVKLCGSGLKPSCDVSPGDVFNVIQTTHERPNSRFIFRVTNTSGTSVRFNVQLEWTKWHPEPMTDDEAYEMAETLRADHSTVPMALQLDGPDWTEMEEGEDVFDLGNGSRPLWFRLDSGGMRYVQVTFRPPLAVPVRDNSARSGDDVCADEETGPRGEDDRDDNCKNTGDSNSNNSNSNNSNSNNSNSNSNNSKSNSSNGNGNVDNSNSSDTTAAVDFRRRVFAAKLNVHVGRSVLRLLYVFGFVLSD